MLKIVGKSGPIYMYVLKACYDTIVLPLDNFRRLLQISEKGRKTLLNSLIQFSPRCYLPNQTQIPLFNYDAFVMCKCRYC